MSQKTYRLNKDFVLTCVKDEIKNTMYTKVTQISVPWEEVLEVSEETEDKDQANKDFLRLKAKYQDGISFL